MIDQHSCRKGMHNFKLKIILRIRKRGHFLLFELKRTQANSRPPELAENPGASDPVTTACVPHHAPFTSPTEDPCSIKSAKPLGIWAEWGFLLLLMEKVLLLSIKSNQILLFAPTQAFVYLERCQVWIAPYLRQFLTFYLSSHLYQKHVQQDTTSKIPILISKRNRSLKL